MCFPSSSNPMKLVWIGDDYVPGSRFQGEEDAIRDPLLFDPMSKCYTLRDCLDFTQFCTLKNKNKKLAILWDFPGGSVVKTALPMQGAWV